MRVVGVTAPRDCWILCSRSLELGDLGSVYSRRPGHERGGRSRPRTVIVHRPARSADVVDAVAQRIVDDQVIDLELDRIDDLFTTPSIDPFDDRALPLNPGIEELVATLCTLRRLPDALTVRIALPDAARAERPAADVEAAIHRRAQLLAVASRRDARAVRSQGRSQSPLGIVIGLVGGFSAYGLA
jgi:hypothetical protein